MLRYPKLMLCKQDFRLICEYQTDYRHSTTLTFGGSTNSRFRTRISKANLPCSSMDSILLHRSSKAKPHSCGVKQLLKSHKNIHSYLSVNPHFSYSSSASKMGGTAYSTDLSRTSTSLSGMKTPTTSRVGPPFRAENLQRMIS